LAIVTTTAYFAMQNSASECPIFLSEPANKDDPYAKYIHPECAKGDHGVNRVIAFGGIALLPPALVFVIGAGFVWAFRGFLRPR
jgi:hypothetical protein